MTPFSRPHRRFKDADNQQIEDKKIMKAHQRNYIKPGKVHSSTHLLSVTKASGADIRMVYNGNSSGINNILWASNLNLHTFTTQMREVQEFNYI